MNNSIKSENHLEYDAEGWDDGNAIDHLEEKTDELKTQDSTKEENAKYRIKEGYILREIGGEYVIIPTEGDSTFSNAMMSPNDTAVFLWKAFQCPSTIEDVVLKTMQEYDVIEEVARKSIEHFVKESLEYKIIEKVK